MYAIIFIVLFIILIFVFSRLLMGFSVKSNYIMLSLRSNRGMALDSCMPSHIEVDFVELCFFRTFVRLFNHGGGR